MSQKVNRSTPVDPLENTVRVLAALNISGNSRASFCVKGDRLFVSAQRIIYNFYRLMFNKNTTHRLIFKVDNFVD